MSVSTKMHGSVLVATIENPPVNALSHAVRQGLMDAMAEAREKGAGAMVIAGQGGTFIAGADIREFGKPPMQPMLPGVVDAIEAMDIPVVAAIEGNTLGGGLEVALGCHYRVSSPSAKLGLPEVNLGLLPGAGGTQRMPRLVSASDALQMVSSGAPIGGKKADAMGLVDGVADNAVTGAIALAEEKAGSDVSDRRISARTLEMTDAVRGEFEGARALIAKRARGALAPQRAADCVEAAFSMPYRDGVKKERETFVELVAGEQSIALRHIFFAERASSKPPKDVDAAPREVKKVGVIGAGTMGGGIAMTYAEAGLSVTILEMSDEALKRGIGVMEKNWRRGIKSGRSTEAQVEERLARLTPTTDYEDLRDADLIIEAVFETMDIKKTVFTKLDEIAKPGAVLASNTSYLNVNEIAAVTSRPEDVLGMHYFSPANIMKLLEIVRADKTADDVLMTALAMAKKTRKTAVVAGVCDGFIGNRMLSPYIAQAGALMLEGASPEQIDKALTDFGWAMGVLSVGDLAGLDIGYKSRKDRTLAPHEQRLAMIPDRIVEAGHLGQKSGSGYYKYDPETRAKSANPEADAIIAAVRGELGVNVRDISSDEIIERTQFALANEGAHILGEGIAQRASDIDVAYVHGYGYARWRGGPMHYADSVGLKVVAEKIKQYAEGEGGVYWTPAPLLLELAEKGMSFADYDREQAKG
ncbi:MAG: 3-hydroxyacyl-CoA dehydrogenase NAD-binding domain-containing protein [Pseudomonadota bacterium]